MKADTGRSSFDPQKHYRAVLRQQGRVDLESDANEQTAIADHLRTTTTADIIGPAGAAADDGGFGLFTSTGDGPAIPGGAPYVWSGNFYLDGLLLENEANVSVWDQPDLPPGMPRVILDDGTPVADGVKPPKGRYLAYLHAWDLHRTALEDGGIREVALGGPDTTTRVKTVWQVRLLRLGDVGKDIDCGTSTEQWELLTAGSTGSLEARAEPDPAATGPCVVPAGAGYRGLENQHYRVEIHQGGADKDATWKWARDNGSTVAAWVAGPDPQGVITVSAPGRDSVTGFAPGMWVELIDDTRELAGTPGTLVQLANAVGERLTLAAPAGIDLADYPLRPRVRRWDSAGELPAKRPSANGGWVGIEDGVQIRLAKSTVTYRTGDHWTIPARSVLGDVLWPRDASSTPLALPPAGIHHHFTRLGLVTFDGSKWTDAHDCRPLFPKLTELTELRAVSGDGQTITPGTAAEGPTPLLDPIVVGVSNGEFPVAGATVYFEVVEGSGTVGGATTATVGTDVDGTATVAWSVDNGTPVQRLAARLLDTDGNYVGLPVEFTASLLTAKRTSYTPGACSTLATVTNVQDALDKLCAALPAAEAGFAVTKMTLGTSGVALANDARVKVGELAAGILIEANGLWDPTTFNPASANVTIEVPWPITDTDRQTWGVDALAAFQPMVVSGSYDVSDKVARWGPLGQATTYLGKILALLKTRQLDQRILTRLSLRGHLILNKDRTLRLDGDLFVPQGGGFGPVLPGGDGRRGGTGEVWFWLVP
ncbi:hypothetical protein Afil01_63290 [Actinorhabdospora filicis]|uniref:Big-1 domain-containing protein n=1 Tax=Actinorhabdospora filicis TaxID=1785913 RepID=A0A9W6SSK2_9ACTN|nr:DUF6519 domain-containing protein [Actinorhabdospora filicis]GLZ81522.1 hypothetical protein Afil01_63290 [Actinorhabdospora filicis]